MNEIPYDGPGTLFIGDIDDARTQSTSHLDRVITVCQDSVADNISDSIVYGYYNMSDGPDNEYGGRHDYELFKEAAEELYRSLKRRESVLIHCHAGQSRSVSVSVAAIGQLLDISRSEAFDIVSRYRPQANPDYLLMGHAQQYIEEHTDIDHVPFS